MMAAGEGSFQILEMGLEKEMIELEISSEIRESGDSADSGNLGDLGKSGEPGEQECQKENEEEERKEGHGHMRHSHKPVEEEKDDEKGVEEKVVEEKEEWWEEEEYDEDLDYYETEDKDDRNIFHKLHKKSIININN